jgi:hypothetical protein
MGKGSLLALRHGKATQGQDYTRPGREAFSAKEWEIVQRFRTPRRVQRFLYTLPYNHEKEGETLRSFRGVLKHKTAHCLEAVLVAATILEQHGYPPLLLDMESQDNLDHVVFAFRQSGRWGGVARSRDFGLQGRKPVFRTLRHLVMSYVDPYVDGKGRITGYGLADLRTMPGIDWRFSAKNVWKIEEALIRLPHQKLQSSDRRYERILRRYLAFKNQYPDRPADFYSNRWQWM